MPPDFVFPYRGMVGPTGFTRTMAVDAWTTMLMTGPRMVDQSGRLIRNVHYLAAVGRLTPGTSVEQARAGMAAIASRLEQAYPDTNAGWTTTVTPLHEQVVGQVRPALLVLLAGVGRDPADGVRQRRQPGAGPQRQPAEGAGGARRARCQPRPPGAAGAHREPAARGDRRAWSVCWWCAGACRG